MDGITETTDTGSTVVQPLAHVDLLLGEEQRTYHATDIRLGGVALHGMRFEALPDVPDGHAAYLVKVNYDTEFDLDAPIPTWLEVGLRFTTADVLIVDALPRSVFAESSPARYAVTKELDFIPFDPDLAGRVVHDQVPMPSTVPAIDCLGIGSACLRWRRTGEVRSGSYVGWLTLVTPAGCQELEGTVVADYQLGYAGAWGMHPRTRADGFTIRLPRAASAVGPGPDPGIGVRLGFTVDVVGYSVRSIRQGEQVQIRLRKVVDEVMADAGVVLGEENVQGTGDGLNAFFPPDTDLPRALTALLSSLPRALSADNRAHDDQVRLRMAVDIGTVGLGPLGFTADAVINFCRLVDSAPIREAVAAHQDATVAVLVSDTVHHMLISRFDEFAAIDFQQVDVVVKNYQARAFLFIPRCES